MENKRDGPLAGLICLPCQQMCAFLEPRPKDGSQPFVIPVPEDPAFLLSSRTCAGYTNPHMDTHIHIIKNNKNKS